MSVFTPLPWRPPLAAARALLPQSGPGVLLYSGSRTHYTGRYSYLALHPVDRVSGPDFQTLAPHLRCDGHKMDRSWFGYFCYETYTENTIDEAAHCLFLQFALILRFDHETQQVLACAPPGKLFDRWADIPEDAPILPSTPEILSLIAPMSRAEYLAHVEAALRAIASGEFYQANLTRKFVGYWRQAPLDPFGLFLRLAEASPGAYSAYFHDGERAVLSSSPERFLTIDTKGGMESRPIKGTAPRGADAEADVALKAALQSSPKERAENLMIVDLMRNDLAKSALPGSVEVTDLFEVATYATLHHMASSVRGQLQPDLGALDALRLAFPPGSMTGAPKLRVIEWCRQAELRTRGVYSGALGWFGGDGSADFSVVIRTLVMTGERFEFQVGGGIVADSTPIGEWRETLTKAQGLLKALGLPPDALDGL